jgi:hypothetical protein
MQRLVKSFVPSFLVCVLVVAVGQLTSDPEPGSSAAGVAGVRRQIDEGGRGGTRPAAIRVSQRNTAEGVRCVRSEGDVDAPLAAVGSVAVDLDRAAEWVSDLVDVRSLRTISETQFVLYGHFGTKHIPDHTFLLAAALAIESSPLTLVVDLRPVTEATGRAEAEEVAEISSATLEFASLNHGTRTHASVDICCEARSDLSFCARELQVEWGSKTIQGLRARLKKGGIAVEPRLKAALDESAPSTSSFESVRDAYHETIHIGGQSGGPDLTKAQLAAPLSNAALLSSCGAPDEMKITVRVAVRMGRAVGVTVTTAPRSSVIASCIDLAVRNLRWESSPNTDFVTTTY